MKSNIILIASMFLACFLMGCKNPEPEFSERKLVSVKPSQGFSGDTISLTVDEPEIKWIDRGIQVFFKTTTDSVSAKVVDIQDNGILKVVVPDAIFSGFMKIEVIFSNKIISNCENFKQIYRTEITTTEPSQGEGGTIVTIHGHDLDQNQDIGNVRKDFEVRINTLTAEIISRSNNQIIVKVPNGAGTGRILLTYLDSNTNRVEILSTGPVFNYTFGTCNCTYYKSKEDSTIYTIERDQTSRIVKMTVIASLNSNVIGSYDSSIYSQDEKLFQVISYNKYGEVTGSVKHSYDIENTLHITENYDSNNTLTQKYEYHYSQGKLVQLNLLQWDKTNQKLCLSFSNQYNYSADNDSCVIKRRFYNEDGTEKQDLSFNILELYDKKGNVVMSNSRWGYTFHELHYNECGYLIKDVRLKNVLPTSFSEYVYECK